MAMSAWRWSSYNGEMLEDGSFHEVKRSMNIMCVLVVCQNERDAAPTTGVCGDGIKEVVETP
jgi:hypothetical protein